MTWPACTTSRTCSGPPSTWTPKTRHRFGSGQYRYFTHDLPGQVRALREAFYPHLLTIARDWARRLGRPAPWPDTLDDWLWMCHQGGQSKSAQILLRYGPGDWNALHRDLFGDLIFPLQVVIGLDEYGTDYTGGEFLLVEQRTRAQSRGTATVLPQGHGLIFTTNYRPAHSARVPRPRPPRRQHDPVRPPPHPGPGLPRRLGDHQGCRALMGNCPPMPYTVSMLMRSIRNPDVLSSKPGRGRAAGTKVTVA